MGAITNRRSRPTTRQSRPKSVAEDEGVRREQGTQSRAATGDGSNHESPLEADNSTIATEKRRGGRGREWRAGDPVAGSDWGCEQSRIAARGRQLDNRDRKASRRTRA